MLIKRIRKIKVKYTKDKIQFYSLAFIMERNQRLNKKRKLALKISQTGALQSSNQLMMMKKPSSELNTL